MFDSYKDVVSIDDVKEMLGIGKNTVYELLRNKQIKTVQLGRKYIIPKQSVIDFLQSAR